MVGFVKGCFYTAGTLLLLAVLGAAGGGVYLAYTGKLTNCLPALKCECKCGGNACETSCCPGVGEKGGDTDAKFDLSPDALAATLVGKAVSVDGLLWNFLPDQKIVVKVLEKRVTGDTASVAVQISAESKIEPAEAPAPNPEPQPKSADGGGANKVGPVPAASPRKPAAGPQTATLNGVARLQYDHVAGTWYLMSTESLSLKIAAK